MGGILAKLTDAIWISFTSPEPDISATRIIIAVILVFVVIVSCYFIFQEIIRASSTDPRVAPANVALAKSSRQLALSAANSKEGFANMSADKSLYVSLLSGVPKSESYLVNLCPLTASIGGYTGPLTDGVFDPEYYVQQALRAGIRSFILPVSMYLDDNKKPPNWPYSGKPAIVCRNADGKILSLNGMSIRKFCEVLMIYKSMVNAQASEPILIYLDATTGYVPDIVRDEKKYVQFTSDIAKELKPLDPFRLLTISSYGSAVGGENQTNILTQIPLTELKEKVLIFTNFNITVGTKDAYSSIRPLLYDYANFTYAPVTAATVGTASANKCSSIHLSDVSGSQVNWTDQSRTSWMIAGQDDFTKTPDSASVSAATAIGIQTIPIPFFFTEPAQTQTLWSQWSGYAWQLKPPAARYTKPPPIVPQNPSTALNARVNDKLQPGQTSVKA